MSELTRNAAARPRRPLGARPLPGRRAARARRADRDPAWAGPVLGYVVGAGVWIVQRIARGVARRRWSADRRQARASALKVASMIGRTWLVGDRHPRRRPRRRAGGRVHRRGRLPRRLHRPPGHRPDPAPAGEEPPPRHEHPASASPCIVGGIYLGPARPRDRHLRLVARCDNEEFKPQNEFKLDTWVELGPFDINKAVLYLVHRGGPDGRARCCGSPSGCRPRPNRVQTAVEWLYTTMRDNITRREHGRRDGAQVVPVHRDAVPLHLVLEPDRLHPAADQHGAQGRRLRRRDPVASRSTPRRRTSRSRSCSRSSCSSPTTSRASARRASAAT